jgi:citrate synthase
MDTAFFSYLADKAEQNNRIRPEYYDKHKVKRGLRNEDGTGVLVGLTDVGLVHGYSMEDGVKKPDKGRLFYRGIDVYEMVDNFQKDKRRGYEEAAYLLLFGELPNNRELNEFNQLLDEYRQLPARFTENMILKIPSKNIMNKIQRSVLVLYSSDPSPDDLSVANLVRQSVELIARFPTIISYGYQAKAHYFDNKSLFIHAPRPGIGTAENILHMTRPDNSYSSSEAELLDLALVLHAEHGGGNNSAFATHVVSSSGTDTYSAIASAVGSLKGHKHGGANKWVSAMVRDIKEHCSKWSEPAALKEYLTKILNRKAFNGEGLIYGMGHAVYTESDPRAVMLSARALDLAKEKGREEEYQLYRNIEELTKEIFRERKGDDYCIAANVDLYSGFVYDMLNIPEDLFTPLFAASRIAGWCAHRIEQLVSDPKIIRPAYMSVYPGRKYIPLGDRPEDNPVYSD